MNRLFDIIFSTAFFVLGSPVFLIISLLVFFFQGTPIFFRQPRLGKNHKKFFILKFRTMSDKRGDDGELLSDEKRITSIGKFLRSTSLDELPGFWNVFRGEMSIVGPRPLPPQYLSRYSEHQLKRHAVKPGVTGWAQVNGRNSITWDEKFDFDVWYVTNKSLRLDFKILLMTISYVLSRKHINPDDGGAMGEFMGSSQGKKK
jgi:lipopolysaccharide/colanic/teichoic acid biosynthesis glycosyltransferase